MLSTEQIYNLLGWEEHPGNREEKKILPIRIDESAPLAEWISSINTVLLRRHGLYLALKKLIIPPKKWCRCIVALI
jgi:hypothetical protein